MATYAYDQYGHSTYGPAAPGTNYPGSSITIPVVNTAFVLPDLGAIALDHSKILIEWTPLPPGTMATVTEFRILASSWGFPVDQNDGTILLDVTGAPPAPGTQYVDTTAQPGGVQYYGFYVLSGGVWLRAGFTACLLPKGYGYEQKLLNALPPFFQNQQPTSIATDIPVAAPSVPASGTSVTNPYSYNVVVWLSEPCNVAVNGVAQGLISYFPLPAGGVVTISYGGTPTWQWVNPASNPSNIALTQFLKILAFGLDTVKSQYDMKFRSLNDPMTMSLGDLQALCGEIGLPYNAEIPAYAMRKAALYWSRVMQERGTTLGIGEHITLLTGYTADIQTSRNFMLDDDQASPLDPQRPAWSANTRYNVGEIVQYPVAQAWSIVSTYAVGAVVFYNDLLYTCVLANSGQVPTNVTYWSQNVAGPFDYVCISAITSLPGAAPSGALSNTANWAFLYGDMANGTQYTGAINISGLAGSAGTWEFTNASGANLSEGIGVGFPTPQTWAQSGATPVNPPNTFGNSFRALNNTGGTLTNTWLRSLCRSAADISAGHNLPDPQLVVQHGVPTPTNVLPWNSTTTYQTGQIVTFGNLNYIALRQSTGATPPSPQLFINPNYDFETNITGWNPVGGATLTQSTAFAYYGTHSLLVTPNGSGSNPAAQTNGFPATPGATYSATTLAYLATTYAPGIAVNLVFYDAFGTIIQNTGQSVTPAAATWTSVTFNGVCPSAANTMEVKLEFNGTPPNTNLVYFDVSGVSQIATPEWAPLGADSRLPVTMSGYALSDIGITPTTSTTVTPFVEWYDSWGNLVTRVFARGTSGGSYPTNYQYDAFDTGAGFPLAGRVPSNPASVWSVPVGTWSIASNGIAYAGASANDAIGAVTSPAAGTAAVTVTSASAPGDDCGVMWWFNNTSNFWVAGLLQLYWVASGTTHTVAYTGTAPAVGDRIYVQFNNTTSTTTMPNTQTVIGPSAIVYKNSLTTPNILVVVGSGGTYTPQTSMSSLAGAFLPSTGATTSNAGIASIVV